MEKILEIMNVMMAMSQTMMDALPNAILNLDLLVSLEIKLLQALAKKFAEMAKT